MERLPVKIIRRCCFKLRSKLQEVHKVEFTDFHFLPPLITTIKKHGGRPYYLEKCGKIYHLYYITFTSKSCGSIIEEMKSTLEQNFGLFFQVIEMKIGGVGCDFAIKWENKAVAILRKMSDQFETT